MKYLFSFLCSISLITSCKKFLNTEPTDFIQAEIYYQNSSQLLNALAGVYSPLTRDFLYGYNYTALMNVSSDEGSFTQPANADVGIVFNNFDYTNSIVERFWSSCYNGIENANLIIANIGNAKNLDTITKNAALGEALFLRGYYHFLLVQNFGDIPLKLTPTTDPNNINIPRIPLKDVYAKIVADMKLAETLVYPNPSFIGNSSSRITKTGVQGILARVYLYMAGFPLRDATAYNNGLNYANKVINSGVHGLNTFFESNPVNIRGQLGDSLNYSLINGNPGYVNNPYSQVFLYESKSQYFTRENIWEADNSAATTAGATAGGLIGSQAYGINNNNLAGETAVLGRASARINATQFLYVAYANGDLRRDWNISTYSFSNAIPTRKAYQTRGNEASGTLINRQAAKWRREFEPIGVGAPNKQGWVTGIKYPLLRYADVLLMQAEAENQVFGPTATAYESLNQVRRRAFGIVAGTAPIKSISITNGGAGYITPPTIVITGGNGSWASAIANVLGGRVTDITITNAGVGFGSAPTISFIGGSGFGATATANLYEASDAELPKGLSKPAFQDSIVSERFKELCFESLRKPDLIRWGIYLTQMQKILAYNNSTGISSSNTNIVRGNTLISNTLAAGNKILLLPIPAAEISVNKAMTQNPGW